MKQKLAKKYIKGIKGSHLQILCRRLVASLDLKYFCLPEMQVSLLHKMHQCDCCICRLVNFDLEANQCDLIWENFIKSSAIFECLFYIWQNLEELWQFLYFIRPILIAVNNCHQFDTKVMINDNWALIRLSSHH